MSLKYRMLLTCACLVLSSLTAVATNDFADTTRAYNLPHLSITPKGTIGMSWTETDNAGVNHLYWSESTDSGKTFGDKKLVYAAKGLRNGRLMRAKVLYKKDGSLVAVFGLAPEPPAEPAADAHAHHAEPARQPAKGGRPRDLQIVYTISNDNGGSWTLPKTVHKDKTPNIIRGFFDSIVLANDEIGVAFLKDTGRPHERDLRFITSTNGVFGDESVVNPFVCDCCNISLLVDAKGTLNMYYRANVNNIRDMAKMSSTDNGRTFSKQEIILQDNWELKGCPHSGPVSASVSSTNLIAWFSGAPADPGVRVSTQDGNRLVLLDPTASNPWLAAGKNATVLLWEQSVQESEAATATQISYKKISTALNSGTTEVKSIGKGGNFTGVLIDDSLVVAYEVKTGSSKPALKWSKVTL